MVQIGTESKVLAVRVTQEKVAGMEVTRAFQESVAATKVTRAFQESVAAMKKRDLRAPVHLVQDPRYLNPLRHQNSGHHLQIHGLPSQNE